MPKVILSFLVAQSSLYLASDVAILQMAVDDCTRRYTKCLSCVRDPHCGWDSSQSVCRPHRSIAGLLQKVSSSHSAEEACRRQCFLPQIHSKHRLMKTEVLSGAPFHINCSLPRSSPECAATHGGLSSHDRVVWRLMPAGSRGLGVENVARTLDTESPSSEFILTRDNGLIVLNARLEHAGVYVCSLSSRIIAQHEVVVSPCSLRVGHEEGWKKEFARWCSAFNAYTQEYNKWLCLKRRCIEEKCIPQSVIDKCLS